MRRVVFAAEAEEALREIVRYSLERWDEDQAHAYSARIYNACAGLCEYPELGRLRRRVRGIELREIQVGSHIVIYALRPDDVLIVGLLHEAMDLSTRRRELVLRMLQRGLI